MVGGEIILTVFNIVCILYYTILFRFDVLCDIWILHVDICHHMADGPWTPTNYIRL